MPQLWTETMVSQYFWLITIFFTLYIITSTKIIPQISYAIKSRRFLGNQASIKSGAAADYSTKSFLSSVLMQPGVAPTKTSHDYSSLFDSACSKWARSV